MHLCTIATVTMHICTVTVTLAFSIFFFSLHLPLSFSIWSDSPPHSGSHSFPTIIATQQRRKKKTVFQPPTQHNPTITTTTQTRQKTHSKSKPKSIKTKSNGKLNPTEISQICHRIYLAAAAATSALLPSPNPTQMDLDGHGFLLK